MYKGDNSLDIALVQLNESLSVNITRISFCMYKNTFCAMIIIKPGELT